ANQLISAEGGRARDGFAGGRLGGARRFRRRGGGGRSRGAARGREDFSSAGGGRFCFARFAARANAFAGANGLAAGEQLAHFVSERVAAFFVEAQLPQQLGLGEGRVA